MKLEVIYEDDDIVAVNKPAGLTVHKTGPNDQQTTLADLAVRQWPQMKDVGEDPLRPGIVHRLDRDTSGVMVLAKTQKAFEYLKRLFQKHGIRKTYLALVHDVPSESSGTIDLPVARIGAKITTRTKGTRDLVERSAITDYRIRTRYKNYTLLECMPKTGRTHQIRAHLKAINVPVVGDSLYSHSKSVPTGLDHMFLHAWKLEFLAPSGTILALEVDLPDSLQKVLNALE